MKESKLIYIEIENTDRHKKYTDAPDTIKINPSYIDESLTYFNASLNTNNKSMFYLKDSIMYKAGISIISEDNCIHTVINLDTLLDKASTYITYSINGDKHRVSIYEFISMAKMLSNIPNQKKEFYCYMNMFENVNYFRLSVYATKILLDIVAKKEYK